MTNGNSNAFPTVDTTVDFNLEHEQDFPRTYSIGGLTKREYFAAMAMQGIVATQNGEYGYLDTREPRRDEAGKVQYDEHGERIDRIVETSFQKYAKDAVEYADALIEELNKEKVEFSKKPELTAAC